jgi:hypothetical protein
LERRCNGNSGDEIYIVKIEMGGAMSMENGATAPRVNGNNTNVEAPTNASAKAPRVNGNNVNVEAHTNASAKAPRVNGNNVNVEAHTNASAKAPRVNGNINVEAPANASAKVPRVNGNVNLEKGNKMKNNKKLNIKNNNTASRPGTPNNNARSHATADPVSSSPLNAEEAGFPPNKVLNIKGGGRKSRKNLKGGRKNSRKNRKDSRRANRKCFCRK